MGLVDNGIPKQLALMARGQFEVRNFVETGTFEGDTSAWAAEHFDRVLTVELDRQRFTTAETRFQGNPKVQCFQGSSAAVLAQIVPLLNRQPALFFLDAHWMADSSTAEDECPVAAEIEAINASGIEAFIIVDDARFYLAPPHKPLNPDAWPPLDRLIPLLSHQGRRYVVIVEDVIVGWPQLARASLIEYSRVRPRAWTTPPHVYAGGIYIIPQRQMPPYTMTS